MSTWISLCCGLDATACRAMTATASHPRGSFAPVSRIGGKRGVADGVLDILGTWPDRWLLVDSDPTIVEFWQATFLGLLPAVAEVIRSAPADGEELWTAWRDAPVPADPVGRVARWVVLQKGNFSSRPVSWKGGTFQLPSKAYGGFTFKRNPGEWSGNAVDKARDSARLEEWQGIAGFASLSDLAVTKGFNGRVVKSAVADGLAGLSGGWHGVAGLRAQDETAIAAGFPVERHKKVATAARLDGWHGGPGDAILLDLNASSPVVLAGDLVTIDPPYRGTTGYKDGLHRDRVVELAEAAHAAGARVLVHEAEPVLEGGPWRSIELPRTHGGKNRTWSKQKLEVATINFPPATGDPARLRGSDRRQVALPLFEAAG